MTSANNAAVVGFSDRCGLAMSLSDGSGRNPRSVLRYYSGDDFSVTHDIVGPSAPNPTSDCGAWAYDFDARIANRYRADGTVAFTYATGGLELADGSWLMIHRGDGPPPSPTGMTIVSDDGTVTFHTDFDPIAVGTTLVGGYLLTPDGILFLTATSETEGEQFAAIEVGIGRVPTWFGDGTNWSHDNATWHAAAAP